MNENANLLAVAMQALNQMQTMKDKLDPEVLELLNKSGHEAITSAHTFLDACEKALDSLIATDDNEDESSSDDIADVVNLSAREN